MTRTTLFPEDFLHYLWKTKQCYDNNLKTTDGKSLEIIEFGIHNHDAGPDFSYVKISIDHVTWIGNMEMHIHSSDWYRHHHQDDKAYDNVILHVVYEYDEAVMDKDGNEIPTLELKPLISTELIDNYRLLTTKKSFIPCQEILQYVSELKVSMTLSAMAIRRLENKVETIKLLHHRLDNDWKATFYVLLARYIGGKVNGEPFEQLALALPYQTVLKNLHDRSLLESLYYGTSGLIPKRPIDDYTNSLNTNYIFLKSKYQLKPLQESMWKFARLRPGQFPTIRIDQLITMIEKDILNIDQLLQDDINTIRQRLVVSSSDYWQNHYTFDKLAKRRSKKHLGKTMQDILIINAIIPFLFFYGKSLDRTDIVEQCIEWLSNIKPESNKYTRSWNQYSSQQLQNALDTQGLLTLYHDYCSGSLCSNCSIGVDILQKQCST